MTAGYLSPEPDAIYGIAEGMLEAACAELDVFQAAGHGPGCPARRCVYPGVELPWDNCDCGLLAVHVKTAYPSARFPFQQGGEEPAAQCGVPWLVVQYAATILRCVPTTQDDGSPPPCDAVATAAEVSMWDRTAVWRGVACYLAVPINTGGQLRPHLFQEQVSLGEQGACAGSELNVLVGLPLCEAC